MDGMRVNTADVTFTIVNESQKNTWAYDLGWSQCVHLMRYLRDSVKDIREFTVWVVNGLGIVTHMVPLDKLCEIAHI